MSEVVTLRFPGGGGSEYRLSDRAPDVGDVLKKNGDNWVVVEVREEKDGTSTVILRPGLRPV